MARTSKPTLTYGEFSDRVSIAYYGLWANPDTPVYIMINGEALRVSDFKYNPADPEAGQLLPMFTIETSDH